MYRFQYPKRKISALIAATLISSFAISAHGEERADLELLRATTMSLIDALVDSGVISRQRANKLIQDAEANAKVRVVEAPGPEFKASMVRTPVAVAQAPGVAVQAPSQEQIMLKDQLKAQVREQAELQAQLKLQAQQLAQLQAQFLAQATQSQAPAQVQQFSADGKPVSRIPVGVPGSGMVMSGSSDAAPGTPPTLPELGKDGKKIVRVPYVPEAVKREIRDQIKQEVLAQSKSERWGQPDALPEWLDRFSFEGDVRMRYEMTRLDPLNTAPGTNYYDASNGMTRAADIAGNSGNGFPSFNTQNDRDRWRLRARLGVNAKVSDMVSAGITLATGNTNERTSTNQTLGQNFNKYSVAVDRAFVRLDPMPWLRLSAGRIANPYFGTDLVWADDLNFEGLAVSARKAISPTFDAFATAGWFPLRENNPGKTSGRNLVAVQGGFDWKLMPKTRLKLGAALYQYHNIEGRLETTASFNSASDYATRYEYPDGLRQRGNTLFSVNAFPADPNINWGLASKFRELDLTGTLEMTQFGSVPVQITGDYVKNIGFNRDEIAVRTGQKILDGKNYGYLGKIQVGQPKMTIRGDWNVSLAYRYLGSDAVLDAFTNSDFGLGGTNNKGTILGFNYGIDKNTWLSARWMSSDVIDPMVPKLSNTAPSTKLSVDIFQLDLNVRF